MEKRDNTEINRDSTEVTNKKNRSDEEFWEFWETLNTAIVKLDVDDPILRRQRKLPKRCDEGSSLYYHQTPKEMYCIIYFEVYDNITNGIKGRFHQPGFEICKHIQNIFINAVNQKCYPKPKDAVAQSNQTHKTTSCPNCNNATSELPFSAMNRIKTYLRNTTSGNQLNHYILLHVHCKKTDQLNMIEIA